MSEAREQLRSNISAAFEEKLTPEQMNLLMDNVLAVEKQARGWCPSCKKAVQVTVSDPKAVTAALGDLALLTWGRPSQEEQESDKGFVFENKVVLVADEGVA